MKLFEDDWGLDNSPIDNTEITTTMLYFSTDELKTFKLNLTDLMNTLDAR